MLSYHQLPHLDFLTTIFDRDIRHTHLLFPRIKLFVIVSQNGTNLLRDNLGDVMYGTIYMRGSSNEKV